MKTLSILFALLFISANVLADSGEIVAKPITIGIGTYATTVAYDSSSFNDDEYSGIALSASYVISNSFALRGTFFSLEDDTYSDITSKGFDFVGHFGTGLASEGFKAYIGGGIFKDTLEISSYNFSKSFSGLQLSGGIGYNWQSVSLDFILGIRDPSDYENFVNDSLNTNLTATVVSGSLIISARF